MTGQLNQPSAPSSVGSGVAPNRKLLPLRRMVFSPGTGVWSKSSRSVGQPRMRNAVKQLASLAATTSVTHSIVLVISLSASASNRLTVTLYVHFAPFASGSGSEAIISCCVSWCFLGGVPHAPRNAAAQARRVGRLMDVGIVLRELV